MPVLKKYFNERKYLYILSLAMPLTILAGKLHYSAIFILTSAIFALVFAATMIGICTEALSEKVGSIWGGIINGLSGNLPELFIICSAIAAGIPELATPTLPGSLVGLILLTFGIAIAIGAIYNKNNQTISSNRANSLSLLLFFMVIILVLPSVLSLLQAPSSAINAMSRTSAILLGLGYIIYMIYSIRLDSGSETNHQSKHHQLNWPVSTALITLAITAGFTAIISHYLVGSIEEVATHLNVPQVLITFAFIPVFANMAERFVAFGIAKDNNMPLVAEICLGSAIQIPGFVVPAAYAYSLFIGQPLSLIFTLPQILVMGVAVFIAFIKIRDGQTNLLEGLFSPLLYIGLIYFLVLISS